MKKIFCVAMAVAVMATACTKKQEEPTPKEAETEAVPMSAEPADPSSAPEDTATTQDPVVLEPIEGETAQKADDTAPATDSAEGDTDEEIVESVDDDAPPPPAK